MDEHDITFQIGFIEDRGLKRIISSDYWFHRGNTYEHIERFDRCSESTSGKGEEEHELHEDDEETHDGGKERDWINE